MALLNANVLFAINSDDPGIHEVNYDECNGTLTIKYLAGRFSSCGICGASLEGWRTFGQSENFITINGTQVIELGTNSNLGNPVTWGPCGKNENLYLASRNGYSIQNAPGRLPETGMGCIRCASNCLGWYGTVTVVLKSSDFGQSLRIGMNGDFGGSFNMTHSQVITTANFPEPTALTSQSQCGRVALSWNKPSRQCNQTKIQIFRDGNYVAEVPSTDNVYYDNVSYRNNNYQYQIRSIVRLPLGVTHYSNYISTANVPIKELTNVNDFKVEQSGCASSESEISTKLSWTLNTIERPASFTIMRSLTPDFQSDYKTREYSASSLAEFGAGGQYSFSDNNTVWGPLAFNTTYYYKVVGKDVCNIEKTSPTKTIFVPGAPNLPSEFLVKLSNNNTEALLSWEHTGGKLSSFDIYRDDVKIATIDTNQRNYSDKSIRNCSEYDYVISASSKCFTERRSDKFKFPIVLNDNLNRFDYFAGSKGFYSDRVTLTWNYIGNSSVDYFVVYRRQLKYANAFQEIARIPAPAQTYFDKDLDAAELYEYAVVAMDCDLYKNFKPNFDNVFKAVGFRSEMGMINGKVTFEGGNAVPNVRITALPTNNIAQGNSIDLTNASLQHNLSSNGSSWFPNQNWSLGFWIQPRDTAAGQNVLKIGALQMSIGHQPLQAVTIYDEKQQQVSLIDRQSLLAVSNENDSNIFSKVSDNSVLGQIIEKDSTFIFYNSGTKAGILKEDTVYDNINAPKMVISAGISYDSIFNLTNTQSFGPVRNATEGFLAGNYIYDNEDNIVPRWIIDNGDVFEADIQDLQYQLGGVYALTQGTGDTIFYAQNPKIYGVLKGDTIFDNQGNPLHLYKNGDLFYLKEGDNGLQIGSRFAHFDNNSDTVYYIVEVKANNINKGAKIGVINTERTVIAQNVTPFGVLYMVDPSGAVYSVINKSRKEIQKSSLVYLKRGNMIYGLDGVKLQATVAVDNTWYATNTTGIYKYNARSGTITDQTGTPVYGIYGNSQFGDKELFNVTERKETVIIKTPVDTLYKPRSIMQLQVPGLANALVLNDVFLNTFNQIYLTYGNTLLKVYVNGELKDSAKVNINNLSPSKVEFGPFNGLLDEVSIWKETKSLQKLFTDFQRYLNGTEANLMAYWRINEGVGANAYDASAFITSTGLRYNEHHATITGSPVWSFNVPKSDQLSYSTYTDKDGNYNIESIAYSGTGQNFRVVPIFNVHEFSPSNRILFIGKGSLVHNNTDFIDLSSFRVTGTVHYDPLLFGFKDRKDPSIVGCGVEDVYFLVDGKPIFKNGSLVKTDRNGYFELEVAIGKHNISVAKNNHIFSVGQWPVKGDYDFQNDVIGLSFFDSTARTVIGKVVGGITEGEKFPGFGRSRNNLGKTKITFQSIGKECVTKTVITDSLTGEYRIDLIPLKYRISELKILGADADQNRKLRTLMEGVTSLDADTLRYSTTNEQIHYRNGNSSKVIGYHLIKNFIYRKPSEILVKSYNNDENQFGETNLKVEVNTPTISTVNVPITKETFKYPVFKQGNFYFFKIKVAERYTNADNGRIYEDSVKSGDFRIENDISGQNSVLKLEKQIKDSTGYFTYFFQAGTPNITFNRRTPARSFTKSIQFIGPGYSTWQYNGDLFRGYILGTIAESQSDFYTVASDSTKPLEMVDFVLRDPPGSNSYAYMEKGTKLEYSTQYSTTSANESSQDLGLGFKLKSIIGFTLIKEEENTIGIKSEQKWSDENSQTSVRSVETKRTVETSKEERNAGHGSDLFIGKGVNIFTPITRNVDIISKDKCQGNCLDEYVLVNQNPYTIGKFRSIAVLIQAAEQTEFAYTTVQIEQEIKALSKAISEVVDTNTIQFNRLRNQINIWKQVLGQNEYQKVLAIKNKLIANTKNYSFGAGAKIDESYSLSNKNTEAQNFNFSFEAGGYIKVKFEMFAASSLELKYKHIATSSISESTSQSDNAKIGYVLEDKDVGDKLNVEVILNGKNDLYNNLSNRNGQWGNILKNKIAQDALKGLISAAAGWVAIAVGDNDFQEPGKNPFDTLQINTDKYFNRYLYDPIFVLKGGRTSCPHEEETYPKYAQYYDTSYTKSPLSKIRISDGSYRRDRPGIRIEPRVLYNVPSGLPDQWAKFDVIFENYNDEDTVRNYVVLLDQRTNGNGATLRIDGERFVKGGTPIPMYAGDQLVKKMTVQPVRGLYDYENIVIYFHSECQFDFGADLDFQKDIFGSDTISVHFLPTCPISTVMRPSPNWIVNDASDSIVTCEIIENGFYFENYGKIKLQFKPSYGTDKDWTDIEIWTRDSLEVKENGWRPFPRGNNYIVYDWDLSKFDLNNGEYNLRWYFLCLDRTESQSQVISGVLDRQAPFVFGKPKPEDGILSPGDQIIAQFNEAIEIGKVNMDNIYVEGRLNNSELKHSTSLAMSTTSGETLEVKDLNVANSPFTIEMWLNWSSKASNTQQILSHGEVPASSITLDINKSGYLILNFGSEQLQSVSPLKSDEWSHLALGYDPQQGMLAVYLNATRILLKSNLAKGYPGIGNLRVGGAVAGKEAFSGRIHELRIWQYLRPAAEIAPEMNKSLSGDEIDLLAYWPLDEAEGIELFDKVQKRKAINNAVWSLEPKSLGYSTNGGYLKYPHNVAYSNKGDFTVAFWFRGINSGSISTLFSNGEGEASLENGKLGNIDSWAIKAMPTGQLAVFNNGNIFYATNFDCLDDKWHHFALSVDRKGYTSSFLDGELTNQEFGIKWSGFGGPALYLGARGWYDSLSVEQVDELFSGQFDELQVWGLARRQQQIKRDKNVKIKGDKIGLDVYLSFEDYDDQLRTVVASTNNGVKGKTSESAILFGESEVNEQSPTIKADSYVVPVYYNFSVKNDQILIDLSENDPALIENCLLDITVRNIFDKQNNRMVSPTTWSVYVDQNQLVWDRQNIEIKKKLYEQGSFEVNITNKSGQIQDFQISNLPSWLKIDIEEGEIDPLQTQKIKFTIHKDLAMGTYRQPVFLKGSSGVNEILALNIEVYKPIPDSWNQGTSHYTDSMLVIGVLSLEKSYLNDTKDMLVAFVNDSVRGKAYLEYVSQYDQYYVYLYVYSKKAKGENITFKIWDADKGRIYDLPQVIFNKDTSTFISFNSGTVVGSAQNPVIFRANNEFVQSFALKSGWQWVSFTTLSERLKRSTELFRYVDNASGDYVSDALGSFDLFDQNKKLWIGSLAGDNLKKDLGGFKLGNGYKIFSTKEKTVYYPGSLVSPEDYPVSVGSGMWNWIGYIGQNNMLLKTALSSIQATEGDIIKSQTQFAVYDPLLGWVGSLQSLSPHQGYMINCKNKAQIVFPQEIANSSFRVSDEGLNEFSNNYSPEKFPNNMTLIASIIGEPTKGKLFVKNGDVIVGLAQKLTESLPYYFLTIAGEKSDHLSFVFVTDHGQEYNISESIVFHADASRGSLDLPFELHITDQKPSVKVHSNPFVDKLEVTFEGLSQGDALITLTDMKGVILYTQAIPLTSAKAMLYLQHLDLKAGIYFVNVKTQNDNWITKLVKL